MKYYLMTVQYNKNAKAENRPQPKMSTDFMAIQQKFYKQVGDDMANATLGGSLNMVVNEAGGTYPELTKAWGYMEEPENNVEEG